MKYLITLIFSFGTITSFSQVKTPVLFISNQDAKLIIDGIVNSELKADNPTKVTLSLGDHLIQAKGIKETLTQTISCVDAKQKVVSLTFSDLTITKTEVKLPAEQAEVSVLNNSFSLGGKMEATNLTSKYFSFDTNDKIKFKYNCGSGGTANLQVYSYPDNQLLYGKNSVKFLADSFTIPKKGVYLFTLSNNYIFNANPVLKISRVPSATSNPNFSTNTIVKYDTTLIKISDDTYTISSSRLSIPVNISNDTKYWAYWLGVGNEAIIKYDTYSEFYSPGKSGNEVFPIYAFSFGKLNTLPTAISRDVIDYQFADNVNSQNFIAGNQYKYYTFKHGNGITSDYSKVDFGTSNIRLLVSTPQSTIGQKIKLITATFKIKETYLLDEGD